MELENDYWRVDSLGSVYNDRRLVIAPDGKVQAGWDWRTVQEAASRRKEWEEHCAASIARAAETKQVDMHSSIAAARQSFHYLGPYDKWVIGPMLDVLEELINAQTDAARQSPAAEVRETEPNQLSRQGLAEATEFCRVVSRIATTPETIADEVFAGLLLDVIDAAYRSGEGRG